MASAQAEVEDYDMALHTAALVRAAEQLMAVCNQVEEAVVVHDIVAINAVLRQRSDALAAERKDVDRAAGVDDLQERVEQTLVTLQRHDAAQAMSGAST